MDNEINYVKRRVSFISTKSGFSPTRLLKQRINRSQNIVDYKALARRAGVTRSYDVKVGTIGTHSTIGQAAQAAGSYLIPGNLGPVRSPVRSAVWRGLTPGKPNIPGRVIPGRDGVSRCPEGYQYGGRFTDNRLSTCGQKLFDLPGPLGLAISAIRRIARGARGPRAAGESTPITGQAAPESILTARRPQIPRVSNDNPVAKMRAARQLTQEIGKVDTPVSRLVRRDGFILEPVVPASVLRAIPDNRDMENATYLLSVQSAQQMGGQELGLLSNTGVTKLTYVFSGGSSISLEKKRPLTVGERRKLGRTVNSAAQIDVSNDPSARLKEVVAQTGDGIGYSENFVNIKNPNELVKTSSGKTVPRWADTLLGKGRRAKPIAESSRETDSESAIGKDISNLDRAVSHIAGGGALNEIDPVILGQAISRANVFKRQKLDARREILQSGDGRKYTLFNPTGQFEHIGQRFASDMQQHLGLESPDVLFVGSGDKRKYLVEDPSDLIRGYRLDRRSKFSDYDPRDVARLMVSDWLTDQRTRDPGSIVPVSNGESTKPIVTNNFTSGLTDLDKIEIVKRQKMTINDFYSGDSANMYVDYFDKLRNEQRFAFRREIDALLLRARQFNFTQFKNRLYSDGHLSAAEKAHIEIIGRILEIRIENYAKSRDILMDILGASK